MRDNDSHLIYEAYIMEGNSFTDIPIGTKGVLLEDVYNWEGVWVPTHEGPKPDEPELDQGEEVAAGEVVQFKYRDSTVHPLHVWEEINQHLPVSVPNTLGIDHPYPWANVDSKVSLVSLDHKDNADIAFKAGTVFERALPTSPSRGFGQMYDRKYIISSRADAPNPRSSARLGSEVGDVSDDVTPYLDFTPIGMKSANIRKGLR